MSIFCVAYFQGGDIRLPEGSRYIVSIDSKKISDVAPLQSFPLFSREHILEHLLENSGTVEYAILNTKEGKKYDFDGLAIWVTDEDVIVSSPHYQAIRTLLSNAL
jgi:hypothetical protein